MPIIYIILILK
jgi:hypothetical protein